VNSSLPDVWLRGPVDGVPALLQPAAHAFLLALEDVDAAMVGITAAQLWQRPGGAASLGFHLAHLSGSTGRLRTYALGTPLSEAQRSFLARERLVEEVRPGLETLLQDWRAAVDDAMRQLAATAEASLTEPRFVGKAQLPTTVIGAIFHAAEHAARHAGQVVTTAKVVRSQD